VTAPGHVDLWWATLDGPAPHAAPEDRRDAARLAAPAARRRLLARRSILRDLLADCLDCGPDEVVLRRGAAGRPEIAWPPTDLRFSASSSGSTALLAITAGAAIGVDVERSGNGLGLAGAEHLFLTAAERRRVSEAPPQARALTALRLWTLKEALAKAMGTGLPAAPSRLSAAEHPRWRCALVPTPDRVVAAVAVDGGWASCRQHRYAKISVATT